MSPPEAIRIGLIGSQIGFNGVNKLLMTDCLILPNLGQAILLHLITFKLPFFNETAHGFEVANHPGIEVNGDGFKILMLGFEGRMP